MFGLLPAGNTAETMRFMETLEMGLIPVGVAADVEARSSGMRRDEGWPCGRPPGVWAPTWEAAVVEMQALWLHPVELDALQAAALAWFSRYNACAQRDITLITDMAFVKAGLA